MTATHVTCTHTCQGGPSKYVDAVEAEGHTVDTCGGHAAPTHQYHLHSGVGMTTNQLRESCELPTDVAGQHSSLLGWMFDGYGLYGRYSLNGRRVWSPHPLWFHFIEATCMLRFCFIERRPAHTVTMHYSNFLSI